MDLFWLLMTVASLVGFAVGYTAVSIAALIEVRRMHREFEAWKEGQK